MKIFIIIISLVLFANIAYSQPNVVISEYINASSPNSEATELIITADNTSLVGYTIRDNSQDGESWRPGIKFRDIRLWRNLRRGTIIIIHHRDVDTYGNDDDKSDGFISVAALNQTYFDHLEIGLTSSLNLNVSRDMIQIRDENDNNVHCLGHMTSPFPDFNDILGFKLAYNHTINQSSSVQVCPGTNIDDYNGGFDASGTKVSGDIPATKAFPNKAPGKPDINHLFWRLLRQPDVNPITTFNQDIAEKDSIVLNWSVNTTDNDTVQGYFIVRYDAVPDNSLPVDSKIYNVGDILGNGVVVGIVNTLTTTKFTDKYQGITCGKTFTYRFFVFRFIEDNSRYPKNLTSIAENARGRAYLDDIAQMKEYSIKVEDVPTFTVASETSAIKFCEGDEVKLLANPSNWNTADYLVEWKNGANVVGTQPSISFTIGKGKYNYTLTITNKKSKCFQTVNYAFEIMEKPAAFIKIVNKSLSKDTTIYICNGESIDVEGYYLSQTAPTTKWIKDNVDFSTSTNIKITTGGVYKFIASIGGLCPDTAFTVTVIDKSIDFTLDKISINMVYPTQQTETFTIFNPNDEEICIFESEITIDNATFVITNPIIDALNPCYKIPAKGSLVLTVTYTPTKFGTDVGSLVINIKCVELKSITLNGQYQDAGKTIMQVNPAVVKFDDVLIDCSPTYTKTVNFKRIGKDAIILNNPTFKNNQFEILDFPATPYNLSDELKITLNLLNIYQQTEGIYVDTLIIQQKIASLDTVVLIPISLNLLKVKYEFSTKIIDFSASPKCSSLIDTVLKVKNIGKVPFTINKKFHNVKTEILNDVTVNPDEEKDVKLRFNFTDLNPIDIVIILDSPCRIETESIRVLPPAEDLSITLINDTIDFGAINVCKQSIPYAGKIRVNGSGIIIGDIVTSGTEFKCETVKTGNPLTLSTGSLIFEALAGPNGDFLDSLQFYIEPCHELITIYVKGTRYGPSSPITNLPANTYDFGINDVGKNNTIKVIIKNPNQFDKILIENASVLSPFFIINPIAFPIEIPAAGQITMDFEFRRTADGAFKEAVSFVIKEPCDFSNFKIILQGSADDKQFYEIEVSIPKDLRPIVGEIFRIPVNFNMKNNAKFSQMKLTNCDLYLSYNPNVIEIRKVYKSYDNLNDKNISFPIYSEASLGKYKVSFEITSSDNLNQGEIVYLQSKALLGNAFITNIIIDSVIFKADNMFKVTAVDGLVRVVGDCELQNRLLEVGANFAINIMGNNPANESTKIAFSIITDDITSISLYNSLGQELSQLVNTSLKPGFYEQSFSTSTLSDGLYFITMKSGINQKTIKFVVSK